MRSPDFLATMGPTTEWKERREGPTYKRERSGGVLLLRGTEARDGSSGETAIVTPRRVNPVSSRAFVVARFPLRTSLQPRAAAAFAALHSLMHINEGTTPQKTNVPSLRGFGPPTTKWLLGPTQVYNPNGILIGSAVLHGSLRCVQQTDTPRYVCSNRPHLCTLRMRRSLIIRGLIARQFHLRLDTLYRLYRPLFAL